MHELSIVQGVIENIKQAKRVHQLSRVLSAELLCGKYNCLSEENLQFYFDILTKESELEGTQLTVRRLTDTAVCADCKTECSDNPAMTVCHACRSTNIINAHDQNIYMYRMEGE